MCARYSYSFSAPTSAFFLVSCMASMNSARFPLGSTGGRSATTIDFECSIADCGDGIPLRGEATGAWREGERRGDIGHGRITRALRSPPPLVLPVFLPHPPSPSLQDQIKYFQRHIPVVSPRRRTPTNPVPPRPASRTERSRTQAARRTVAPRRPPSRSDLPHSYLWRP